jgi:hypothetical protein
MEVFRGKLGKAAAKLAGPGAMAAAAAAAAAAGGSSSGGAAAPGGDDQATALPGISSRELLEVLAVRAAAAGGLAAGDPEGADGAQGRLPHELAGQHQEGLDAAEAALSALVSGVAHASRGWQGQQPACVRALLPLPRGTCPLLPRAAAAAAAAGHPGPW